MRDYPLSLWTARRGERSFENLKSFVMFIGYPRSGHSIVGSLLNAHPNVVIGHRLRVLRYVHARFGRKQLCGMVMLADERFARLGRVGSKRYNYSVPGQWQGRYCDLQVIGDSNVTNNYLRRKPELLPRLREVMGVPVKLVHVVRNPYDNISTMSIRNRLTLQEAADRYFTLCDGAALIQTGTAVDDWFDLRHEDLLDDPMLWLDRLCVFVGVAAHQDYLNACASVLYRNPHHSRHEVDWSHEMIQQVQSRMVAYPFLRGYAFEQPAASAQTP
ncbi:MAG TPA: hypothetical protein VK988_08945 [Acidimicrobiales bacterium]|nr:hypothetical protein [Acidimicrobiales bacterium]